MQVFWIAVFLICATTCVTSFPIDPNQEEDLILKLLELEESYDDNVIDEIDELLGDWADTSVTSGPTTSVVNVTVPSKYLLPPPEITSQATVAIVTSTGIPKVASTIFTTTPHQLKDEAHHLILKANEKTEFVPTTETRLPSTLEDVQSTTETISTTSTTSGDEANLKSTLEEIILNSTPLPGELEISTTRNDGAIVTESITELTTSTIGCGNIEETTTTGDVDEGVTEGFSCASTVTDSTTEESDTLSTTDVTTELPILKGITSPDEADSITSTTITDDDVEMSTTHPTDLKQSTDDDESLSSTTEAAHNNVDEMSKLIESNRPSDLKDILALIAFAAADDEEEELLEDEIQTESISATTADTTDSSITTLNPEIETESTMETTTETTQSPVITSTTALPMSVNTSIEGVSTKEPLNERSSTTGHVTSVPSIVTEREITKSATMVMAST